MRWVGGLLLVIAGIALILILRPDVDRDPQKPERIGERSPAHAPDSVNGETSAAANQAVVFGTVRRSGQPVVGRVEARFIEPIDAEDDLLRWPVATGPALAAADTDIDGRFEIGGLPSGRLEVRAIAEGGGVGRATAVIRVEGLRVRADVRIPSGPHTFRGRAVWSDGRPFRGLVSLCETLAAEQSFDADAVQTSTDGLFEISGLDGGMLRICTLSADRSFRTLASLVLIPYDGEYELVVDRKRQEWTGQVLAAADGSPVPGAELEVTGFSLGRGDATWTCTRARTNGEGRFRFLAPHGVVLVSVRSAGHVSLERLKFEHGEEIEIRLDRSASVSGTPGCRRGRAAAGRCPDPRGTGRDRRGHRREGALLDRGGGRGSWPDLCPWERLDLPGTRRLPGPCAGE